MYDLQAKSGTSTFTVSTTGSDSISGYVEAIEILENPIAIGGGGLSKEKPVQVEVYTSGSGGILIFIIRVEL